MVGFAIGTYAVNGIILGWVGNTSMQTKEKKAASLAIVNTVANASFIWTPVWNRPLLLCDKRTANHLVQYLWPRPGIPLPWLLALVSHLLAQLRPWP